jgi:hypothetical protein
MTEEISIGRLLFLRKVTRAVSEYLLSQLREQLTTLSPLLRPRRVLGDYIDSGNPEPVLDADRSFAALNELYAKAAGKPFDLPRPLRPPLKPIGLALEVHPWEYLHELNTGGVVKVVTITSPVRYVVSYTSGLSLSRLRLGIAGKEEKKPEDVREFVIRSCILHLMLTRFPGITNLLRALRWEVDASTSPELGDLPLVTLTAPLKTVLPPDNLILDSTEMSGTSVFEEVVDVDEISRIEDPLVQKVQSIMAAAQGGTSRERT